MEKVDDVGLGAGRDFWIDGLEFGERTKSAHVGYGSPNQQRLGRLVAVIAVLLVK